MSFQLQPPKNLIGCVFFFALFCASSVAAQETESFVNTDTLSLAAYRDSDVAFSVQDVTFPASPTDGMLWEVGGSSFGMWVGILHGKFHAQAGTSNSAVSRDDQTGEIFRPNGCAAVIADVPDAGPHSLLVHVTPGSETVVGSIRVYIDCVEIGVGFAKGGPMPSGWTGTGTGTFLAASTENMAVGTIGNAWPGSASGALTFYAQSDAMAASLFDPFSPVDFGCDSALSCDATETEVCDVPRASCFKDGAASCECQFPFTAGDGTDASPCALPLYSATGTSGAVLPTDYTFPDNDLDTPTYTESDVIFYTEAIKFPSGPTDDGMLFHFGGSGSGIWVGILNGNFHAQAGIADSPVTKDLHGRIDLSTGSAAVIAENFPTDDETHSVLVHVSPGSQTVEGSLRVFIDCEEIGVGFSKGGPLAMWSGLNPGSYLLSSSSTLPVGTTGDAWPGGAEGASVLNIYSQSDADAAGLFAPFTPFFFGCTDSCDATETATCDVPRASCEKETAPSCQCNFPFTAGDGTLASPCTLPVFTATGTSGPVPPVDFNYPDSSFTTPVPLTSSDVVFYMENITFPSSPGDGMLFEFGGQTHGMWVGILNGKFHAQTGDSGVAVTVDPVNNLIIGPFATAAVITDNFPKDDKTHSVLIYVSVGTASTFGSIHVYIDCEERGVGYTTAGALSSGLTADAPLWTGSNGGAYLMAHALPNQNYAKGTTGDAWPGGAEGASVLNIYSQSDADAAGLFAPFTPFFFGCSDSCDATETATCDVPLAACSKDAAVSCDCNFPFTVGEGTAAGSCDYPLFRAMATSGPVEPTQLIDPTQFEFPQQTIPGLPDTPRFDDAIFFVQGITFPEDPEDGMLFHFGASLSAIWVGILNGKFHAQTGSSYQAVPTDGSTTMPETAFVITDDFPKDGEKHFVLIYVKVGDTENQGSIQVWIDCKEVGVGYTAAGALSAGLDASDDPRWSGPNHGAYLIENDPNAQYPVGTVRNGWPGGVEGGGVLNMYFKSDADSALLFAPFTPYYFGCGGCNGLEKATCDEYASCSKDASNNTDVVGEFPIECTCNTGFEGDGETCTDIKECFMEDKTASCHGDAYCQETLGSFGCVCQPGFVGEGDDVCYDSSWGIRSVFSVSGVESMTAAQIEELKHTYGQLITRDPTLPANSSLVTGLPVSFGASRYGDSILEVVQSDAGGEITFVALFLNKTLAEQLAKAMEDAPDNYWDDIGPITDGPEVYRWVADTTGNPIKVNPTGLTVDSVSFDPSCLATGCWRVEVTYTVGLDNFNVFFLPKAVGDDAASYDFDYDVDDGTWGVSPADTFNPNNHPCNFFDYDPSQDALPAMVTACCLPQFLAMYRPVTAFADALDDISGLSAHLAAHCGPESGAESQRVRAVNRSTVPRFAKRGQATSATELVFAKPTAPSVPGLGEHIFASGVFAGMNLSSVNHTGVVDEYIGSYTALLMLDEVELRQLAGQLRGTVGVEYTVDTFVGLQEFSPTGIPFLDPHSTQINIHLEKTSFFTVSTHGTNEYTFLEYVNMRLVKILSEDADFSGAATPSGGLDGIVGNSDDDTNPDDEAANRTTRTSTLGNVGYLQVTFTMGSQYQPNMESGGLIPLDSVRVGKGTFLSSVDVTTPATAGDLTHVCNGWTTKAPTDQVGVFGYDGVVLGDDAAGSESGFLGMIAQGCGPGSDMCSSPTSVPDQFVSFNIPLGTMVFEDPSSTLDNNIFVQMVINAIVEDDDRDTSNLPNDGGDPYQMKTTLTGSIPIVEGGVNIFCDGLVSKTDLKDVADVDVLVGTASSENELTRLRIVTDIASTNLESVESTEINTDSIESALMTLVLKGNTSYFSTGASNTGDYSLELDDVITIHLMEDGVATDGTDGKDFEVRTLLARPGDDNSDSNGLDTDGYAINGAFSFSINRAAGTASLEPSEALLGHCAFNPPRPTAGNSELETCVIRRDVRQRGFPVRVGAGFPTAMEVFNSVRMQGASYPVALAGAAGWTEATEEALVSSQVEAADSAPCPTGTYDASLVPGGAPPAGYACEAGFMTSVLGDSTYARQLAKNFVSAIRARYDLNGRYTRAYWINPGYEWTPTQTGGTPLFSVSQKLYLFALVSLDQNWSRRRMLLSATDDALKEAGSGAGSTRLVTTATPQSIMAKAFAVPEDKVALFDVEVQLTRQEACMAPAQLQDALRLTLADYLSGTASAFHTVQVVGLTVHGGGNECGGSRRMVLSSLGMSEATATVKMMVVFEDEGTPRINLGKLSALPGINAVQPDARSVVEVADDFSPPPRSDSSSSSSDSSNTALIAGVCGGVGGLVLVVAGFVLWSKARRRDDDVVAPVLSVYDLKTQLADDV